ncbi:hypothetical protein MGG_15440 [Pyricularia oryzae 70-15]|uniref:Uncharacterized protein n=3 Tax=Pyricularia oryzae TaxID=318829 RepID=G4NJR1_PYRO7|nr:uncharacterized protein MGG_15440 [Pyricularia oryzae 70-15]EHA45728.1 hypothetical protein MGG_15440 [Pyricularia oryzae 70-15]ELQ33620.1 hypothetical protein OOU_Y34scaffold00919g3 [Pyricularia oryzae Y34]
MHCWCYAPDPNVPLNPYFKLLDDKGRGEEESVILKINFVNPMGRAVDILQVPAGKED